MREHLADLERELYAQNHPLYAAFKQLLIAYEEADAQLADYDDAVNEAYNKGYEAGKDTLSEAVDEAYNEGYYEASQYYEAQMYR